MLNKIYLAALGILVLPVAFLTYYSGSWLHSIGDPNTAKAEYFRYSGLSGTTLLISFVILIVLANMILWTSRRAWAIWASFLYLAVFVIVRFWWLEGDYLDFARRNSFTDSSFSLGPLIAIFLVAGVGALVFFDQFIVLRLAEKMHPTKTEVETTGEEVPPSEPAEE